MKPAGQVVPVSHSQRGELPGNHPNELHVLRVIVMAEFGAIEGTQLTALTILVTREGSSMCIKCRTEITPGFSFSIT